MNGAGFDLHPEDFLLIPWAYSIHYIPHKVDPFLVAGIHLIPYHCPDAPMEFTVPHSDRIGPYFPETVRRDAAFPGFESLYRGSFSQNKSLGTLAEYVVASYTERPAEEVHARRTAALLIEALQRIPRSRIHEPDIPPRLLIRTDLPIGEVGARSGIADPYYFSRLFKKHYGMTAGDYRRKHSVVL